MAKKKKENPDAAFEIPIFTPENKDRVEEFFEKYKKQLTYGLGAIALVLLAFFGYKNLILKPKEKDARDLIFIAQNYFAQDSFQLALYGSNKTDQSFYGFLDIIDEFGMTRTGNLAKYYAGLCYLHLNDNEEAIRYLKKYKTSSPILGPLKLGAIGDAYANMQEYEKAASYYMKAAKKSNNKFTTPFFYQKAGIVYEAIEKYDQALKIFKKIKEEFPKTQEGNNADKYIGRIEYKMKLK